MPLTIISNNLHLRISKNTLIINRLRKKTRKPGYPKKQVIWLSYYLLILYKSMLFTIRQEPGCSENFTPIISLDRH